MNKEHIKVQLIVCNTCNANIAGCVESAINKKWLNECRSYTKTNRFRIETLDNSVDFSQPLSECCKLNTVGAPKKAPTFKPSLRCKVDKWKEVQTKYPGRVNKMFNDWLDSI